MGNHKSERKTKRFLEISEVLASRTYGTQQIRVKRKAYRFASNHHKRKKVPYNNLTAQLKKFEYEKYEPKASRQK